MTDELAKARWWRIRGSRRRELGRLSGFINFLQVTNILDLPCGGVHDVIIDMPLFEVRVQMVGGLFNFLTNASKSPTTLLT